MASFDKYVVKISGSAKILTRDEYLNEFGILPSPRDIGGGYTLPPGQKVGGIGIPKRVQGSTFGGNYQNNTFSSSAAGYSGAESNPPPWDPELEFSSSNKPMED